jgi:hypothetical protein
MAMKVEGAAMTTTKYYYDMCSTYPASTIDDFLPDDTEAASDRFDETVEALGERLAQREPSLSKARLYRHALLQAQLDAFREAFVAGRFDRQAAMVGIGKVGFEVDRVTKEVAVCLAIDGRDAAEDLDDLARFIVLHERLGRCATLVRKAPYLEDIIGQLIVSLVVPSGNDSQVIKERDTLRRRMRTLGGGFPPITETLERAAAVAAVQPAYGKTTSPAPTVADTEAALATLYGPSAFSVLGSPKILECLGLSSSEDVIVHMDAQCREILLEEMAFYDLKGWTKFSLILGTRIVVEEFSYGTGHSPNDVLRLSDDVLRLSGIVVRSGECMRVRIHHVGGCGMARGFSVQLRGRASRYSKPSFE